MITKDGQHLTATSPEGLVAELHRLSHTPAQTDKDFMSETVKRVYESTGHYIRDGAPADFIADLVSLGLLIKEGK